MSVGLSSQSYQRWPGYGNLKGDNTLVVKMVDSIGVHEHAIGIVLRSRDISID